MKTKTTTVSADLCALCCGISRAQFFNLVNTAVLPRAQGRGKYDLVATVRAFIEYRLSAGPVDLAEARLRLTNEQIEGAALRNRFRRGELCRTEDFGAVLNAQAVAFAERLNAMPRILPLLSAASDPGEQRSIFLQEIREVRQYMADTYSRLAALETGLTPAQITAIEALIGVGSSAGQH